jgi:hypothetical protein
MTAEGTNRIFDKRAGTGFSELEMGRRFRTTLAAV